MWPFKSRKEQPGKQSEYVQGRGPFSAIAEAAEAAITTIEKEFPLGSSFVYLGKNMVVAGHTQPMAMHGGVFGMNCIVDAPSLMADYLDDAGVIQSKTFDATGVLALMESLKT